MVEKILGFLASPIKKFIKWQRVEAIAAAAMAAKDTSAGHRVYLRSMTMLEIELGVQNEDNCKVSEGHLDNVQELMEKAQEEPKAEELLLEDKNDG